LQAASNTKTDSEAILPNRIQVVFLRAISSRENGLSHPAKGGSTPAFAYQRAAIAPLPCLNLQLGFIKAANSELASFKKCNCNRKNRLQNQFASQMWATRPHLGSIFEKLLHRKTFQFACGSDFATALNQSQYSGNSPS
jgi:hypothetical protein